MKKRIASMLLAAMMAFSTSAFTVSAKETIEENKSNYSYDVQTDDGDFDFKENEDERMASDGSFTFIFSNGLRSDFFTLQSSELHLEIDQSSCNTPGQEQTEFTVTLYEVGFINKSIETEVCQVGFPYFFTFTGLDTSKTYYLQFYATKISNLNAKISGSGRVYNINLA